MKKKIIRGLVVMMLPTVMLMSVACGDNSNAKKDDIVEMETNNSNDNNNIDEGIKFSDFLVERCVRQHLNKKWNEPILISELENMTSLVIDNEYDPTFMSSMDKFNEMNYAGYIDLTDLKYFTNLEELKIDAYDGVDTVVNIESIMNCKKLKSISIPCSQTNGSDYNSLNRLGYKYLADIFAELPELEYADLGFYVDEHIKEVILSKTDNKDVTFYDGPEVKSNGMGYYKRHCYGYVIKSNNMYNVIDSASAYSESWKYEYKGMGNAYLENARTETGLTIFTALEVDSQAELVDKLSVVDKDIEDLIIIFTSCGEVDFSVFESFENLVTLTIYNKDFGREYESVWNEEESIFDDVPVGVKGIEAINIDKLTSNKNLQVINLGGFIGDLSDINKLKNLRELSIIDSQIENVDFISDLQNVKELILEIRAIDLDNASEIAEKLDEEVCSMDGLKMYRNQNSLGEEVKYYENIENMKSLESLYEYNGYISSVTNIMDSDSIKNLKLRYSSGDPMIDNVSFADMNNLENLMIVGYVTDGYNYENILQASNLISVMAPNIREEEGMEEIYTTELSNKVKEHGKISAYYTVMNMESRGVW